MTLTRNSALQILGLSATASDEDIKDAYRKLARKYHPDVSKEPDAEKKMRAINEARDFLAANARPAGRGWSKKDFEGWTKEDFEGFDWAKNQEQKKTVSFLSMLPVSLTEAFLGAYKLTNFSVLGNTNFNIPIPKGVHNKSRLKIISSTDEKGLTMEIDVRAEIDTGEWKVIWAAEPNLYGGGIEGSGDMEKTIYVDMLTMMTGGSHNFDTIDGVTLQLRIIAGMEAGTRLKVKGRGYWKDANCSARGDVYLRVFPKIRKIDDISVEELEKLAKEFTNAHTRKRDLFQDSDRVSSSSFA